MSTVIGDPEAVCAALDTILDGLAVDVATTERYTVHAFNPPPVKLDTAELPGAYAFTGAATDDEVSAGSDDIRETRAFALQVAVMPTGQGTPQEREKRCRPILLAVKNLLREYPHLGVAGVERMRVVGDSGITVLPEFEGAFIGFEIRLQVVVLIPRAYAAYE
jgi:hypothetical protein